TVAALRQMNLGVLRPLRLLALGLDRQPSVLDLNVNRIGLDPRHIEVKVIAFAVLDYIRARHHVVVTFRRSPSSLVEEPVEPVHPIIQPAVRVSVSQYYFHLATSRPHTYLRVDI